MQVVIVGGGFAGISAALELSRRGFDKVTLISDQPYFLNRATLHKVASLEDETASVIQIEDLLAARPAIKFVHGSLSSLDPKRGQVVCKRKKYHYDKLILALGTTTDYANAKGAEKHSYDVESLSHLRRLRQHLFDNLSSPQASDDIITIVGGGSTGVELAGSLASLINRLKNKPSAENSQITIGLIEKQARLLPYFSKTAGHVAQKRLQELGVNVITGQAVTKVEKDTVALNGQKIPSQTTVWATGTTNNRFYEQYPDYFQLDKAGNVLVDPYLEAYQDIYVLGDSTNIHLINSADNAIDMASYIADHFARQVSGRSQPPFKPRQHLVTVPIGDDWAYAEYRRIYSSGRFGYQLHSRQTIKNYRQIMSKYQAARAWRSYGTEPLE